MAKYEVRLDKAKCAGFGYCEKVSPDYWLVAPDGKARIKKGADSEQYSKLIIDESSLKKNLEAARVCPTNAIDVINLETGKSVTGIEKDKKLPVKRITAHYDSRKEWKMDPKGFFTIKPFPEEKVIRVRYYNAKHQLTALIEGKNAEEIYNTIIREGFVSNMNHAAYLGSELQKAEIALKHKSEYVQDDELKLID
jgi:ferredoxin